MKLYCSGPLQKLLDRYCLSSPAAGDPLEEWYAKAITLEGKDAVIAMLPAFRFCVLLPDIAEFRWDTLQQRLVQAIRDALDTPTHIIPQAVIDRYIPEDTVFYPCASSNQSVSARLNGIAREVMRENALMEPEEIQHTINNQFHLWDKIGVPFLLLAADLRRRYEAPVQAIKLKTSLDLGVYDARRTLLVSQDATFEDLHNCLQTAYRWRDSSEHAFLLPASGTRPLPVRVLPEGAEVPPPGQEETAVLETGARLLDYLQEKDTFQYRYGDKDPWQISLRFTRYVPYSAVDLPACTLCEGAAPPEDIGGKEGYQAFYRIIQNPKDPEYKIKKAWADPAWHEKDSAESISSSMHDSFALAAAAWDL